MGIKENLKTTAKRAKKQLNTVKNTVKSKFGELFDTDVNHHENTEALELKLYKDQFWLVQPRTERGEFVRCIISKDGKLFMAAELERAYEVLPGDIVIEATRESTGIRIKEFIIKSVDGNKLSSELIKETKYLWNNIEQIPIAFTPFIKQLL